MPADWISLLPLILLAATPTLTIILITIRRNHELTAALSIAGLVATLISLGPAESAGARRFTALLVVDRYAIVYTALIAAATLAVVLLSHGYLKRRAGEPEEFYVLLLTAAFGSAVLASSSHFASFFLGLEILSVSLYALIAYPHTARLPLEAAVKYLVLAGASSAFLLFGMALIYADTGTMDFGQLATRLGASGRPAETVLVVSGTALMLVGIGFKLAVVPFHMWTPDVYQGAPAPVTTFVATVSKGGMFALLLRYFLVVGMGRTEFLIFSLVAIASMAIGNLLALLQTNVKRILAYSSIAHLGYMLVAFLAGGPGGTAAATFYLAAYFVTMLGAFGVVTVLSPADRDADSIDDYRGLFWRRPVIGGIFTAMLLSLAGIPLTAGFVGKFYLLASGSAAELWPLVFVLVVTSVIGLFYYLRIVVAIYASGEEGAEISPAAGPPAARLAGVPRAGGLVLAVLAIVLVWLGTVPGPFVDWIRRATSGQG